MTAPKPANILQEWLVHLQQQGKSQHTVRAYRRGLTHFGSWYEGTYGASFAADDVMPRDVRDWKAYQQAVEQTAPATVNQRLVALTHFFRWARGQGLCRENPAEDVSTIRLEPRHPKALKPTALRKLLRAARGHRRDYAMLEMLAGTGLRVGELLELKIGDVDISERSGKLTVRRGKYDNHREIPLTLAVRKALSPYRDEEHPDRDDPAPPCGLGRVVS